MPEPTPQYPTPTLEDSHQLIQSRSFQNLAQMRQFIEQQADEIDRLKEQKQQLENELFAVNRVSEAMSGTIDRLEGRIDNALAILSGENTWLALVLEAKAELEKAKGGF